MDREKRPDLEGRASSRRIAKPVPLRLGAPRSLEWSAVSVWQHTMANSVLIYTHLVNVILSCAAADKREGPPLFHVIFNAAVDGNIQEEAFVATKMAVPIKNSSFGKNKLPALIPKTGQVIDWDPLLAGIAGAETVLEYGPERHVFSQGQPADSVFYLRRGKVKLSVISPQGKEAIVAVLAAGEFFGEGCLAGQPLRISTATAVSDCTLARIDKKTMTRMLHEHHDVSELFTTHLLSRNIRYEADLIDQLFNSSEKRLARLLLLLAHFGKESKSEKVIPGINQEALAQMVGTTRSRISHFMNKFKQLGFVDYGEGDLTVNSGLLSVILYD
jgi:CRP/FNR family cyclic AMP-dependent transcriptional regulator